MNIMMILDYGYLYIILRLYAHKWKILIQYIWAYPVGNQFNSEKLRPLLELDELSPIAVRSVLMKI
jgi:hypothetical protein